MSAGPKILLSAGEASGDRLGADLARALRERLPSAELLGMGGDDMQAAGVRRVQDAADVAVVGLVEVLSNLPRIRRAMRRLEDALDRDRPDLVVPIDFPDFNLRLAARAAARGIPVVYFVSPQVWAWRSGRVRAMRGRIQRMLVLFPFEVPFYERAGIPATFVGHPAIERVPPGEHRPELLAAAGLDPGGTVVALLPGSRRSEVDRLFPIVLEAARRLREDRPDVQFLIPRASTIAAGYLEDRIAAAGLSGARVHAGDFPAVLTGCAAGAVASGTATLEAALAGLPMVVIYRLAPLTYALGRRLVRLDHVALPNLIAGRRIVPELIQDDCRPETIARELAGLLQDSRRVAAMRGDLAEVRARLGEPGACVRAAEAIARQLSR